MITEEKRRFTRVVPLGLNLVVKTKGWFSMLAPNLAMHWIDVSEDGLGVLVSRKLEVGQRLRAFLSNPFYSQVFDVTVEVRHIRESQSSPGYYVAGLQFVSPKPMMRMCIRSLVDLGALPPKGLVMAFRRAG